MGLVEVTQAPKRHVHPSLWRWLVRRAQRDQASYMLLCPLATFPLHQCTPQPATSAVTHQNTGFARAGRVLFHSFLGEIEVPAISTICCAVASPAFGIQQNSHKDANPISALHWHHRDGQSTPFKTRLQSHCLILAKRHRVVKGLVAKAGQHDDWHILVRHLSRFGRGLSCQLLGPVLYDLLRGWPHQLCQGLPGADVPLLEVGLNAPVLARGVPGLTRDVDPWRPWQPQIPNHLPLCENFTILQLDLSQFASPLFLWNKGIQYWLQVAHVGLEFREALERQGRIRELAALVIQLRVNVPGPEVLPFLEVGLDPFQQLL
mmetsp:Transcript_87403/g.209097  ORF Transcript_87403/g.209097 Transcript_87403/m.209097 type:complete len:319 (+) Transcript_87403:480-1436(+)